MSQETQELAKKLEQPTLSSEEKRYILLRIIMRGDVVTLRDLVWSGIIKAPQDLVGLDGRRNSALHVAAKCGQAAVLQFLVSDMRWKEGDEVKTATIDPFARNAAGQTAKDIAKQYGNRFNNLSPAYRRRNVRGCLVELLTMAEIEPEGGRERSMQAARNVRVPEDVLPKSADNLKIRKGTAGIYTGSRDEDGHVRDAARLFLEIRQKYIDRRKALNEALAVVEAAKGEFLSKAKTGQLTEADVAKYVTAKSQPVPLHGAQAVEGMGLRIDVATDRGDKKGNGGKNALHYAIERGHPALVKMLVEGVEVTAADGSSKIARIDFDKRAGELLKEALARNPLSAELREIDRYVKGPVVVKKVRPPSPDPAHTQGPQPLRTVGRGSITM